MFEIPIVCMKLKNKIYVYGDLMFLFKCVYFVSDLNAVNQCGPGYLKCIGNDPLCIADSLRCNGDNNCGDSNRSDEDSDCNPNPWVNNNGMPFSKFLYFYYKNATNILLINYRHKPTKR